VLKTVVVRKEGQKPYLELRHNGTVAKIYSTEREKNGGKYAEHTLTYSEAGRRVRKVFGDLANAKAEAEVVLEKLSAGQGHVLQLTAADRESYLIAVKELGALDVPLHAAAREYRRAVTALHGKGTINEAVQYYVRHAAADLPTKTMAEIVGELLEAKKLDRRSDLRIKELRLLLNRFARDFTGPIAEITSDQIETWLRSLPVGPRTRNNYAGIITTAFEFARRQRYLPKDQPTAAADLARAKLPPAKIGIYTPAQVRGMLVRLQRFRPDLLPFVAIGAFAGLRPEREVMRLDWSDIRLDEGLIHIRAENAKTRQRRFVPIHPNLAAWLLPLRKTSGSVCPLYKTQTLVAKLCRSRIEHSDGRIEPEVISDWPVDVLRHSYGSHRLPILKSDQALALEMGNTPAMVFRHYRELVTAKQAEEYWAILPSATSGELIPMPETAATA